MLDTVIVGGQPVRLTPRKAIGKGGEADVYGLPGGKAVKVYKEPDHPDYAGLPLEQEAARRRLAVAQEKLPAFPALPLGVVGPEELVRAAGGGGIVGFVMELIAPAEPLHRYGERAFRDRGVPAARVVAVLRDLRATLAALHARGIVVGDLNDVNVLVRAERAFVIDADSFSFGPYECPVFTDRFVDPLLLDPATRLFAAGARHHPGSDWYAFTALVMQSLLLVGPYGGTHRPRPGTKPVPPGERPFRRLTVLAPEVRYPRPAFPPETLPDALLQHFHAVFVGDERAEFPARLLEQLAFSTCPRCGLEHARRACPACAPAEARRAREVVQVSGDVVATRLLETGGLVVHAAVDRGVLRWLVHERGGLAREDGERVLEGALSPELRFGIAGEATLVARGGRLMTLRRDRRPELLGVDCPGNEPAFATDGSRRLWVSAGRVLRDGALGPELVGEGLEGQTRLWLGPTFGFGLYRAGALCVCFVLSPDRPGLRESLRLPRIPGTWLALDCVLGPERAWVLVTAQQGGKLTRHCVVVRADAAVEGSGTWDEPSAGPGPGACAAGAVLLSPTDDGITRFELEGGEVRATRTFPATRPWVDAGSRLLVAASGLHVVHRRSITRLVLS